MMLTRKEVDAFLKDIEEVCSKHGIYMEGGCYGEGIESEIYLNRVDPKNTRPTQEPRKFHDCDEWCVDYITPRRNVR
ncbi:hypothetical protein VpaJT1_87 [Vibrio phage VpaJT_1]|nr:hypothetical protein VpaJT1_87 [Vibrio phage VpaJT_1]